MLDATRRRPRSNSIRIAAMCCLMVGGAALALDSLDVGYGRFFFGAEWIVTRCKPLFITYLNAFIRYKFQSAVFTDQSKSNLLDLADCDVVFGAVVEFGGPGRLIRSHLLDMLEP
jgi:hypothetical protein